MLHDVGLRTTLTLDDDVAAAIERLVRRTGRTYRAVVNAALRTGLEQVAAAPMPFVVTPHDLDPVGDVDADDVWALIARTEGPLHR